MVELKRQINELSHRLGLPPPYSLDFAGDTGNPSAEAVNHQQQQIHE